MACLLAGCAGSPTMDKAMSAMGLSKPTSVPALPGSTRYDVPVHLFAGGNLNAGSGNEALALVVRVYQLRGIDRFGQVPFDQFLDAQKERAALGPDLVDVREMLVLPTQHYDLVESMPDDVHYIGVVALFRAPAAGRWRFAYDARASLPAGITLGAHACALTSTTGRLAGKSPDAPATLSDVRCDR